MVAGVEVGIDRIEIGFRTQPGDLARDGKDRVRNLADDHVHFVGLGRRDYHVGVARAGLLENVRMRGKTHDAAYVVRIGQAADEFGVTINDRDLICPFFPSKMARDLAAHLPCPADDDLHALSCLWLAVRVTAPRCSSIPGSTGTGPELASASDGDFGLLAAVAAAGRNDVE